MAITFKKKPQVITPTGNDILFQFTSGNNDIVYFDVDIINHNTDEVINTLKVWTTPADTQSGFINLKSYLHAYTESKVFKNSTIAIGTNDGTLKYRIKITEQLYLPARVELETQPNGSQKFVLYPASSIAGLSYNNLTEYFTVVSGGLNRLQFNYFNYRDFLLNTVTPLKFATSKPNNSVVTSWSTDYLGFFADASSPAFKVQVKTYKTNTLFNTYNSSLFTSNTSTSWRVNTSPKDLVSSLNVDWTNVTRYSITLMTAANVALSEVRNYYCFDLGCTEPVNLLWVNEYGFVDSFTFLNPQETLTVTKKSMDLYGYKLDNNGIYSNQSANMLNPDTKVLSSVSKSKYDLITYPIDDLHFSFLTKLIESKQVFVELSDYNLLPVTLNNTSVQVQRRKYSKEVMRFPISFNAEAGLNVSTAELVAFGYRVGQIGFTYNTVTYSPSRFYTTVIGNGTAEIFTVTHSLNSKALNVEVLDEATGQLTYGTVTMINVNQITIEFSTPPTTNSIRLNIFRQD